MSFLRQEPAAPAWFLSLAFLGTLYASAVSFRLLAYLALCLRRPKDLRRRYGAWAVVTGPTSGIGRSVALELASRGLNLVLVDLDADNLREISNTIRSHHAVQTKTVVFDLSLVSTAQGDEALRRLREAVAGLDVGVLVNNAGVAKPGAVYLREADVEACVRLMRVNLWAVTEVTAAVLPGMVERGRGAVVNMGSASSEAIPSFPLYTMYAATKRYVAQFSRSLYVEYRSEGIDVQCQQLCESMRPWIISLYRDDCPMTRRNPYYWRGSVLRGDQDGLDSGGERAGRAPLYAPHRADARRVRACGGALDRPRPAPLRPQPRPPAPVVPRHRPAGLRPRLAPHARAPAAQSGGSEGAETSRRRANNSQVNSWCSCTMCLFHRPRVLVFELLNSQLSESCKRILQRTCNYLSTYRTFTVR
ncbi:hypothetical protein VPH35_128564 [Triticum aestivum]